MRWSERLQQGQAMTEVALIILAVALVVVVAMFFLGDEVNSFIQPVIDAMQ